MPKSSLNRTKQEVAEMLRRNPALARGNPELLATLGQVAPQAHPLNSTPKTVKAENKMSQSEQYLAALLDRQVKAGEIAAFAYEAITLVVGEDRCKYTPDFVVWRPPLKVPTTMTGREPYCVLHPPLFFIEMKGAKKWEDSIIKFKAAKKQYPYFDFQMWEYTSAGGLTQLY